MKLILLLLSLFVLPLNSCDQDSFLKASGEFEISDFKSSLNTFDGIKNKGPLCHYNIGVCKANLGDFSGSIAAFLKASKNANYDLIIKIKDNVKKVESLNSKEHSESMLMFRAYLAIVPFMFLQIMIIFLWSLFFVILIFNLNKFSFLIRSFILIFALLFTSLLFIKKYENELKFAIVKKDKSDVYLSAGNFQKIDELFGLSLVKIESESEDWIKIEYKNIKGWIASCDVEKI